MVHLKTILFIIFVVLFSKSNCEYDFIFDSLKTINQSSDPCDDFYRHACPIGNYGILSSKYYAIIEQFSIERGYQPWQNLTIERALKSVQTAQIPESPLENIFEFFKTKCEKGEDTIPILERLEHMLTKSKTKQCQEGICITHLSADKNCTRSSEFLMGKMVEYITFDNNTVEKVISKLQLNIKFMKWDIDAISLLLSKNLMGGVYKIEEMVDGMIDLVNEWIEETPWLRNLEMTELVKKLASNVYTFAKFGTVLEQRLNEAMTLETNFLECLRQVGPDSEMFCILYEFKFYEPVYYRFFNFFNAYNEHPILAFGLPLIHVAENSVMAAKLGYTGCVAGHELAHTLIEDPNKREMFPAYSNDAIKCVQEQYNATCEEFKEDDDCFVIDYSIDENGSDVLGVQLAYQMFDNHYGSSGKDEYIKLNKISITNQQLFFYSYAFTFCNGFPTSFNLRDPHASSNIRINAIAQHPAFQDAFKCSAESRMMRTVKKQCIIFGKDAPAQ